jgi:NTP pyrophosphatase (non-canonical NTP hydrolase)
MTLKEMQERIIANRINRNCWTSATDLQKTTLGLVEEIGEFEKWRRKQNIEEMIDGLGDTIVFALGGLEILGVDAQKVLEDIIIKNESRTDQTDH